MDARTADSTEYAIDRQLRQEEESLKEALAQGSAGDFAQYQYMCGKIRGIRIAMETVKEVRTRLDRDQDFS